MLCQLPCCLVLRPHVIKPPQAKQHWEDLLSVPRLLAQYSRLGVYVFYFRSCKAPGGQQRPAQGNVQREFSLSTLGSVRQSLE